MIAAPRADTPPHRRAGDWYGPALLAASLLVHVVAFALLLRTPHAVAAPETPAEIPVEVVQQVPAEKPKPASATPSTDRSEAAAPHPTKAAAAPPKARRPATPDPSGHEVAERMQRLLGPMPAAVMPAVTSADNPFDDGLSYRQMVLSKVARQRREDRHNGVPGHVVVAFTIGDAGDVASCAVREKSVDPALDAEAVAMVYRGAPYPVPPPGAGRAFTFGLAFRPT